MRVTPKGDSQEGGDKEVCLMWRQNKIPETSQKNQCFLETDFTPLT